MENKTKRNREKQQRLTKTGDKGNEESEKKKAEKDIATTHNHEERRQKERRKEGKKKQHRITTKLTKAEGMTEKETGERHSNEATNQPDTQTLDNHHQYQQHGTHNGVRIMAPTPDNLRVCH